MPYSNDYAKKLNVWNYQNLKKNLKFSHWPTTSILRSFLSTSYYHNCKLIKKNDKVLDIGTLYTNNLWPFHERKCKLYAVETTNDAIKIAKNILKKKKIECILKKGTNQNLPFENNYFDFLLSINTIHYEQSEQNIIKSLSEYKRVLKTSGCLILQTVAPKHSIYKNSKKIQKNIFQLNQKNDFRDKQKFFFFNSKKNINNFFLKFFRKIEISEIIENYPKETLNFFDIKCFK
jgi:ubiquinone/menaquinone biosynthesis C-methylase UbiE